MNDDVPGPPLKANITGLFSGLGTSFLKYEKEKTDAIGFPQPS